MSDSLIDIHIKNRLLVIYIKLHKSILLVNNLDLFYNIKLTHPQT